MKSVIGKIITIMLVMFITVNTLFPCFSKATAENITNEITIRNELTKEEAKSLFLQSLASELQNKQTGEYKDLDEETQRLKLEEYFNNLISEHTAGRGDFYNTKTKVVGEKIVPESAKQQFYSEVPNYIKDFIEQNLGEPFSLSEAVFGSFSIVIDGIAGVLLYPFRLLFIIVPGAIIETISTMIARIGSEGQLRLITLDEILFNKIPLTDINIFDFQMAGGSQISSGNVLYSLRENISTWYYALRNLAIALSLAALVYVGVRMAISTIAEDRAKYKKMLKDWIVSFALIFLLHYIMVLMVNFNNGLVSVMAEANEKQLDELKIEVAGLLTVQTDSLEARILLEALHPQLTRGMTSAVMYFMLTIMTFLYIILYMKRLITISFLAMIAPLITVTYPIDKVGDGKAQALGKWLKEFAFNVLIQPFHCIIYMVFIQNIFYIINNMQFLQFGRVIIAICMCGFMYKAEDIVRSIFGFQTTSLGTAALIGVAAWSKIQKVAKTASDVAWGVKGATQLSNVATPDKLPSKVNLKDEKAPESSAKNENNKSEKAGNGEAKSGAISKLGQAIWRINTGKTARKIAKTGMFGIAGYAMSGDYKTAEATMAFREKGEKTKEKVKAKAIVESKKDDLLDAYQDYKEDKGLSAEEMLSKSEELLNTDLNDITDEEDRNFAEWLQAGENVQKILGEKDAKKSVMDILRDYEGEG